MTDIKELLDKYDNRVLYEERSIESDKIRKRKTRLNELHNLCEGLFIECKTLCLTGYQKERVHFLIDKFGYDFKSLHGNSSKKVKILAFIFYIKKLENPRVRLDDYSITKTYGLTDNIFEIIICRVCETFIREAPIVPHETSKYDHEILSRNGGVK
ncbi:MAG: hypothetical protein IJG19_06610 [Methanobrevibacter sp.]|nr:hypothetical protein [Methanobrevibacter sp.]